jgi:NADH:ubiquinone oxidoreductase subunit F (NADH-binding)
MMTGGEAAAFSAAVGTLKKPVETAYEKLLSKTRSLAATWIARGAAEKLKQQIESVGKITTIASRQSSTIDEIYYPSKLKGRGGASFSPSSADQLLPQKTRIAVITGVAGQGKSVLMRYL